MRFLLVLLIILVSAPASAAEFKLDARYSDVDKDLVADIPLAVKDFRDPASLTFGYPPLDDTALMAIAWAGFLKHLEKVTGKQVVYESFSSTEAEVAAMRSGKLDVAGFSAGAVPLAVSCAGARPFAVMAAASGEFGYQMEIITPANSEIKGIEDIKGKTLAFTAKTSNSGYKAPTALLSSQFGLTEGPDYTAVFTGKHDNSIRGVARGELAVAAVASEVRLSMEGRGEVKPGDVRVIYRSQTFPTTGYAVSHDLTPTLQTQIAQAFFTFNWEGSSLAEGFSKSGYARFVPITFREDWSVIRQVDDASGASLNCL